MNTGNEEMPQEEQVAEEEPASEEAAARRPLTFRHYDFKPRAWERERIHRYSVRRPRWWSLWLKLRELGAKVGIG